MIFQRSSPRSYADYRDYRRFLRTDFRNLCAYCLRHEYHMGGEANAEIDHHCPLSVCPERETDYTNLYLSCAECNGKKRETWPLPQQLAKGVRFIDPCQEDHLDHWQIKANGHLVAKTRVGEYSIDKIGLDRASLNYHRAMIFKTTEKVRSILANLRDPLLTTEEKKPFFEKLDECLEFLQPPVFPKSVYNKRP